MVGFLLGYSVFCLGQQVTIPSSVAATAFANAKAMYVPDGQPSLNNLEKAYLMRWVVQTYRNRPLYSPVQLKEQFDQMKTAYEQETGLQLGMVLPNENEFNLLSSLGTVASTFASTTVGLGLAAVDIAEGVGQVSLDRADSFLRMSQSLKYEDSDLISTAEELDKMCANNNVVAIAREMIFGIPPGGSAVDLFQFTSEFSNNPTLQSVMAHANAQGGITISVAELTSLFQAELAKVNGSSSNILTAIGTLTTNQGVLLQYMTNIAQQLSNQAENAAIAAQHQKVIDAANSSVYILSTLVGFNDPKLGHDMQVVGGSTIQIADALGKFTKNDALQNIILSGNVLSAAMNVVSLFGDSGPSPDQMILQELGVIKQMLGQIRTEMHERFDRVDRSLNIIYETLNNRFDQIDLQLGILQGDVTEIQQALYGLQVDLYRIERGVYAFLDATSRRDLAEQINLIVDYHNTYGQLLLGDRFITAENKFQTWATINAKDEASSGSGGRGYSDSDVYAELTARPLEGNLNWLVQFLTTRFSPLGVPNFTSVRLANPHDWSVAANGYLELALESPLNFRATSASRLEQIRQVGVDLANAATNITLTPGATPIANRALFSALIDYYRTKALAFKQALSAKEQEFRLSLSTDAVRRAALDPLNLWGGPQQATAFVSQISTINPLTNNTTTHGLTVSLIPPANWQAMVPALCNLADLIGVGAIQAEWYNLDVANQSTGQVGIPVSTGISVFCNGPFGSLQLDLRGETAGALVFHRRFADPPDVMNGTARGYLVPDYSYGCLDGHNRTTAYTWSQYVTGGWTNGYWPLTRTVSWGRGAFDNRFVAESSAVGQDEVSAGLSQLSLLVDQQLRSLQRANYAYVSNSLSQANSLQSAASDLSGAKCLLEAFIVLGFSQSLERDDILRSLLYSTDRIADTDVVKQLCQLGIANSYDTSQNAKVDIAAILDGRITALETWITKRLAEIDQSKRGEPLLPVTLTLNRIRAFQQVQGVPTPAPYLHTDGRTNSQIFWVAAEPNVPFLLQSSMDMSGWTTTTSRLVDGGVFSEPRSASGKFYRLVLQP